jgi:hypothetical protein
MFALAIAAASAAGQSLPPPPQTAQNGPQKGTTAGGAPSRVHLQPKLVPGDVMRYQVQFQTTSQTTRSGVVSDPQGPSQTVVTWDAILRVEVLPAPSAAAGAAGAIRLRTTYEKSVARLDSDTPDPEQESVEKQYAQMEGKSMEFTLDGAGRVSNVQGLEGIVSGADAVKAAGQWMAQFSASTGAPAAGIALGEKWNSEESAASLPLAGYVWHTDSTYLRNEACHPASLASAPAPSAGESCAVILAQLTLRGPRSKKDPTPQEFRRNGLETSGVWSGSGDSLTYISLENGWVVSVTQNMSEQMDVTISKGSENGMHYAGTVATRSSLSLVPPDPATSPDSPR